ncbi:response regulator [Paucibacter sp. XJ19-41]|uniref:response regulator n=1 Tax=Paucibacter sp. XJ19-41 TaxID=2927824 RepID=UPI0023499860|nr:response regulator [Paucibacter sp. XJ19-41]MDC6168107.1 response regulator [Paucibacter sp. XJ19-41]
MNARILIVEDQADIRRLIRWALEDSGHRLHEAANGALALQIVQAMRPDLMLIDVVMPGEISGLDLCKQIRQDPTLAGIRLVVLSASAALHEQHAALDAGADAFLAKPFSPGRLRELVEELLHG